MIRLYGHLRGSFRTVSEGLKLAFEELGVLSGYVIGEQLDFDSDVPGGSTAPIAVVVGDPLRTLMAHLQGDHEEIWLMLAPNSYGVPPKIKAELLAMRGDRPTVDGLLAPSYWAARILKKAFPTLPVQVCQHGVLPFFRPIPAAKLSMLEKLKADPEAFMMLHVTSTGMRRKCTREVIDSWKSLHSSGRIKGRLCLSVNPDYAAEYVRHADGYESIQVLNGQNYQYESLAMLYRAASVVVQPSRAEGFGLVPLEARACGTPAIATFNTGHEDHVLTRSEGWVSIDNLGALEESDDYWGATAHAVSEQCIEDAMLLAYTDYERLSAAALSEAKEIADFWTWKRGATEVVQDWKKKYDC